MNSTYKLAIIFLGSAFLAQPSTHTMDKMPGTSATSCVVVAYCKNVRCWQQAPCGRHQADTEKLTLQKQKPILPTQATLVAFPSIIVPRYMLTARGDKKDAQSFAPISSPTL